MALAGLLKHGKGRRKVYVFHERLHPIYQWILRRWLWGSSLDLVLARLCASHGIHNLPHHFSPAILLRLLVSHWIPEGEFIYLDADVLIQSDLETLDRICLDDALLAASPRHQGRTHLPGRNSAELLETFSGRPYFATGLLLINARRFESQQVGERCLRMIAGSGFDYPDQDALNLICQQQPWISLPEGVSVEIDDQPMAESQPRTTVPGLRPSDPAIVLQLAGAEKPWHLFNRHPLRKEFGDVLRTTPLALLPCGFSDIRWRSLGSRWRRWLMRQILIRFAREGGGNRS